MPAKKTDWKKERKRLQNEDEDEDDPDKKLGAEMLMRMRAELPHMQYGQMRRAVEARERRGVPAISRTMEERLCGLFGGGRCKSRPRPSAQAAWDQLTD